MREVIGDIFEIEEIDFTPVVGMCFTSNGMFKKDGRSVMGAGVAKAFRDKFKDLDLKYGQARIRDRKNIVTDLGYWDLDERSVRVIAFPTKNDWRYNSTVELITLSAMALARLIGEDEDLQNGIILLPRPGCTNGNLNWDEVRSVIKDILPENVVIISNL